MPSEKRLNSVCHSIAHHAVSSLSYVHPHLRQACKSAGNASIVIDLTKEEPCPEPFRTIEPLRLSLGALRIKFGEILKSEGFATEDVRGILLQFEFPENLDDYCSDCHACLVTKSGKEVRAAMEAQKFIREALAGTHKDLGLPAPPEEMRAQLARQEAFQKAAEAKGGKNMQIKDKFEAVGMISDYCGVYADLCSQSHHTLPALRARHFEKKGDGVSITYYRLTNLDEVEPYMGYASVLLVGATEHVHDLLNKPCPELVNSMRARLNNAATSQQA